MIRVVWMSVLCAAAVAAQDGPAGDLAALQQAADKKAGEWDGLAKGLEAKIARLLPCDPRVRSSIEEVSQASQARLTALRQYIASAAAQAKADVEAAQALVAGQAGLTAEMNTERAEADQARSAIEGQLAELGESAKRRPALEEPQKALAGIAEMARQRASQVQEKAGRSEAVAGLLKELDTAYQSRQKALETEVIALVSENARWSEYYTARLLRSLTECSITNAALAPAPAPAPRPAPGKKQ